MTALAQFDKTLESLLGTKAPGVSGSKVQELTKLAVQNVKDNAQFITHLYKHFRLSPGTHKLGVLYVVDSISRMYQEQARRHGQDIATTTDEGTFASGLRHITTVLPSLMNDITQHSPDLQKEKIRKLLDIWERSKTFPNDLIAEFRQKLQEASTTPTGTPPPPPPFPSANVNTEAPMSSSSTNPPDAASILSALAAMAKSAPPPAPSPALPLPSAVVNPPFGSQTSAADPRVRNVVLSQPQAAITPTPVQAAAAAVQPAANVNPITALAALLPQAQTTQSPAASAIDPQKLAIIQILLQQGVPVDQVAAILNPQPQQQQAPAAQQYPLSPHGRRHDSRSRSRSPPPRRRSPSRSMSPPRPRVRGRRRDSFDSPPPRRRRSPSYDDYRRSLSRSRSPPPRRRDSPPPRQRSPLRKTPTGPPVVDEKDWKLRFIEWDDSLKPDRIRGTSLFDGMLMVVLSRTLFVGGVTNKVTEEKLRELFTRFGPVQSIIMNPEKRCAFLKMYTRDGAVSARQGMEAYPTDDTTIRTKYGVGFGPRDCSDYSTGISIVPIARLTDADRKWVVTAEYGGTGGRPLEAGMTIEEPDIEIGAGVSSKAISQKIHLRQRQDSNRSGVGSTGRGRGRNPDNPNWNQSDEGQPFSQGHSSTFPPGFPPFPMIPGQQGMFPSGQFPPFMMPPQMQAFFQQQFSAQQGQQGQDGFSGGYSEHQGNGGQSQ